MTSHPLAAAIAIITRRSVWLTLLLFALLLPAQVVLAGAEAPDTPVNKVMTHAVLCVKGTVIGHDEKLLTDPWTITATPYTAEGELDSDNQLQMQSAEGQFQFDDLTVGNWHFAITLKPDYEAITAAEFDVPVDYAADCHVIRFKVRRLVSVEVLKIDDEHTPLAGWTIRADPAADNYFALPKSAVTDANGYARFRLTPGNWNFSEIAPAGVKFTPVIPQNGKQSLNVQPPGPFTIRFKNRITPGNGCIVVTKYDVPPDDQPAFGLPGWRIDVLRADGSKAASSPTDAFGRAVFNDLPPGPYVVTEEDRVNWKPDGPNSYWVTVVEGSQCAEVIFSNEQDPPGYCMVGRKIDTNGKIGLPNWKITATPLSPGGYVPDSVVTDGLGNYRIDLPQDDYRIPGTTYRVCEEQPSGWLPHTPTCRDVKMPLQPAACVVVPDFENQQVGHAESQGHPSYPDQPSKPTEPGCRSTHSVKAGEYLSGIAANYSIRLGKLINANPWVRQRWQMYLKVGDQLCIP